MECAIAFCRSLLADPVSGNTESPEPMDIDEAINLRPMLASLPRERREKLYRTIREFVDSLAGTRPASHGEWHTMFINAAKANNLFEAKLGVLMMTLTARTYVDWLITMLAAKKYPLELNKLIAGELLLNASTVKQCKDAEKFAEQVGIYEKPVPVLRQNVTEEA
jgi:hypothetical protein